MDFFKGSNRYPKKISRQLENFPKPHKIMDIQNIPYLLNFFKVIYKLKTEKRRGWIDFDVSLPESISDHQYMMSILTLFITDPSINKVKCLKMSLVHDMAECITTDITPRDGIPKEEKSRMEREAMQTLLGQVNGDGADASVVRVVEEIVQLWEEYESAETAEAKIVKDIDKLEMMLQASMYENDQDVDLTQFYQGVKWRNESVGRIADEIVEKRNK